MKIVEFNPAYKGITIFLISLILSFEYNYYINLSVFLVCIFLLILNKVKLKKSIIIFIPIFVMALGMFFTGYLYGDTGENSSFEDLIKLEFVYSNLILGLELSSRILAYGGLGMLFIFTVNPKNFILSLMQQFKLPEKFAYGMMAGYNFVPIVMREYITIKNAYRMRGVKRNIFMLPMLVSAVRSSENIAMAMQSKGFQSGCKRSYYNKFKVKIYDYLLIIILPTLLLFLVIKY